MLFWLSLSRTDFISDYLIHKLHCPTSSSRANIWAMASKGESGGGGNYLKLPLDKCPHVLAGKTHTVIKKRKYPI